MMMVMASPPGGPTHPGQPPSEPAAVEATPQPSRGRGRWAAAVRWVLIATLAVFACLVLAAVGFISLLATPLREALNWPYPLTQRTNVLIMGLDRTVSDRNPNVVYPVSRTDTLIAATFDPAARRIFLLSVPRDTRAAIPHHVTTKINAAHAWGGVPLTLETAQNFLGVRFPYYIEINERGLVHLIDAVGGVNIHIEKDLNYDDNWDGLHIHLQKGYRRLGGKAAMEYSRFRHDPLGDIGRITRQQQVMNALLDELRRPRIATHFSRLLRVFHEDITTNLSDDQLVTLALFGARLPAGALVRETLPGNFGGDDWIAAGPQDRGVIAQMFYGTDADVFARTTAEVVARSVNRDAVNDAVARLRALGIRIERIRTASSDPPATAVLVHRGDPRVAKIVAALIGGAPIVDATSTGTADLTVILSDDASGSSGPTPPR
ncbi:MAG TPA: LCP family protein [bacterium]|nr:LCP family protein [bacterium]